MIGVRGDRNNSSHFCFIPLDLDRREAAACVVNLNTE